LCKIQSMIGAKVYPSYYKKLSAFVARPIRRVELGAG